MNVLHIIGSMDPVTGGPAQGIRNLATVVKLHGVKVEVVCLDPEDSSYLEDEEMIIHALGTGISPWRINTKLDIWLKQNIRRFDVVISNGLWLYSSFAAWRCVQHTRKQTNNYAHPKFFVMPHGMLDPYFQTDKDRWLKAIRNWAFWKLIEKQVVNGADGLLFTCETELKLAATTFTPYHPKQVYNAGYGIENPPVFAEIMTGAFQRQCIGLNGMPYLLYLSRIHTKKATDLLIQAYIRLHQQKRDVDKPLPKLVIAGPGSDSLFGRQLLQTLNQFPEVAKDVFFPGMLTGDAKWGAFYGCEAFVLPSHQENFGIVVAEALACGKPVLISNQVNIWREISAGNAGFIEDDTLTGTENLLRRWCDTSNDEKQKLSLNSKKVFKEHFSVANTAIKLLHILENSMGTDR